MLGNVPKSWSLQSNQSQGWVFHVSFGLWRKKKTRKKILVVVVVVVDVVVLVLVVLF